MRKVLLALFAALVFGPACYAQQSAWADKLFSETTRDFGVVPNGAQLKYSFKITNIYKVPLEITDVRVSCSCVRAEASTRVLQPNETATLNVSMDGRRFVGYKSVRVQVTVGPKYISTATLTVSANARGDVAFSPTELDFGNLHRSQTPAKSIDVEYTGGNSEWRVIEIQKSAGAPFELKVEELPRLNNGPPRRGYRIVATIKADAAPGTFKQEIILKTNDPSASVLTFPISGNVQAGLTVSPSSIFAKELKAGETQTKLVYVRASRPFRITGVEGQGDDVKIEVPNQAESTQVLKVHISAAKAGPLRRELVIRTDLNSDSTLLVVEAVVEP